MIGREEGGGDRGRGRGGGGERERERCLCMFVSPPLISFPGGCVLSTAAEEEGGKRRRRRTVQLSPAERSYFITISLVNTHK